MVRSGKKVNWIVWAETEDDVILKGLVSARTRAEARKAFRSEVTDRFGETKITDVLQVPEGVSISNAFLSAFDTDIKGVDEGQPFIQLVG